mmetsp:Transcript_51214/g.125777  ORF Transcript_51214/g.125777 Transcript_51214/m.125777 type:complete len:174 (-) Transcript_51214:102-623(-)
MPGSNPRNVCAMVPAPALTGAAASNLAVPVVMGGVALAGDLVMRIDLPKIEIPKVEMPKVELPKVSLPKLGGGGKKKEEAVFIDDNPNAPTKPKPKPKPVSAPLDPNAVVVRAAPAARGADAPSLSEIQKGGGASVTIAESGADWKAFPGRRMPGKNMESFLDIAKDYWKDKK